MSIQVLLHHCPSQISASARLLSYGFAHLIQGGTLANLRHLASRTRIPDHAGLGFPIMVRRLCQLILMLLSLSFVFLPYTEHTFDWDKFPIASSDLELQVICCLCAIGIFLVVARQLRFSPKQSDSSIFSIFNSVFSLAANPEALHASLKSPSAKSPLRI